MPLLTDLAVGLDLGEVAEVGAAGADHELDDAALGVGVAVRVLRAEPLVGVVMPGEDHVDPLLVEQGPDRGEVRIISRARPS